MAGEAGGSDMAAHGRRRGVVGGRNLPVATAVGVVMAAAFVGALWWDPAAFTAVVAIVMLAATFEADRVLRPVGYRLQVPVLVASTLIALFGAYGWGYTGQSAGVVVLILGSFAWKLSGAGGGSAIEEIGATLLFGLWVGFLGSFAVLLVLHPRGGPIAVLAVIGAAIFADIGAYAVGVAFGRRPLAPRISPNKSWEGLIGGSFFAAGAGAVILPRLDERFSPATGMLLALLVAVASAIGDLGESMVKRDLGVKDLGGVLPGHGGILDRVDGILVALPVGYLLVLLLF